MKHVFIFALFFFFSNIYCQELKYEDVISLESKSKSELYNTAKTWATQTFNNENNKVTNENFQLGELSGIGTYDYRATKKYLGSSCVEGPINYKFTLIFKDGKYKYVFHSFIHNGSRGPGCGRVNYGELTVSENPPLKGKMIADNYAWHDVKEKTSELINSIVNSLTEALKTESQTNSNW